MDFNKIEGGRVSDYSVTSQSVKNAVEKESAAIEPAEEEVKEYKRQATEALQEDKMRESGKHFFSSKSMKGTEEERKDPSFILD